MDHGSGDENIVGRGEIIVVGRTEKTESVGSEFENTFGIDDAFGVERIDLGRLGSGLCGNAYLGEKFVAVGFVIVTMTFVFITETEIVGFALVGGLLR